MTWTINEFSSQTGLSPSTLRYYDKKDVLKPAHRSESGYRLYTEEQLETALMIHSLRQADVAIEEIKQFLLSSEEQKYHFISKWQQQVESKLHNIQIAKQYLGGIRPMENHVHLVRWNETRTFIWFRHTVERNIHPFKTVMEGDLEKVKKWEMRIAPGIFVKTLDSVGETMTGEVGFLLEGAYVRRAPLEVNMYVEHFPPQLFATMEGDVTDPFLCFAFIQMLQKYGFQTKGQKLERFGSVTDRKFTYFIPLMENASM
ncbi:MerR family transcriptional regulator [Sporosarcina sp. Te-1]|uniref:helix-turn-helix domain-containing protein n=1 Tax=Sporosarcina sp. Te-1 TaxID=2818390 RepID=UPI001A9F4ABA|nr:MerR family transcriptional regulator [Sporosarcina sp. Te-1]QTD43139.1 MerR family transcriptional regulator [Sporosarcina sp. Te-1]